MKYEFWAEGKKVICAPKPKDACKLGMAFPLLEIADVLNPETTAESLAELLNEHWSEG